MSFLPGNIRFAVRTLSKSPGFALTTIATLALGIGANTAIFTVSSALLLRPFPYRAPEQLVNVRAKDERGELGGTLLRYEMLRDQNHCFESVAVWTNDNLNLNGPGEPVQVRVARVSPGFFGTLGIGPELGRAFLASEGRPDGKPVVMLSDSLWRGRFQGDRGIIGQTVTLDGTPHVVVGVLPGAVQFPFMNASDIWTPRYFEYSVMTPQRLRLGVGYLNMLARLRAGTILESANAELAVLNKRYREQNPTMPDAGPAVGMAAEPLRDQVVADVRGKVLMLSAAVGVLLLIACANVANLLLSRTLVRKREMAVRRALGASNGMLVRQLLTENVIMALIAGGAGIGLSWVATRALLTWGVGQLPEGIPIGIDLRVLLFTLVISLGAGIIFGTFPAWQLTRADLQTTLRDEGRGLSASRTRVQMKNLLVVSQIALALFLLIGAGLLVRSFERLLRVQPGFDAQNVLTLNISLPTVKYGKAEQQIAFFDEVLRRAAMVPGVRNVATSAALPLSFRRATPMLPQGQPAVPLPQRPILDVEAISPSWFQTMRVPLRGGRAFSAFDSAQSSKVAIVNEAFARRYWRNQNALGKHILIGRGPGETEVVGVAGDVRNMGLARDTQPQIYLPFPQLPWGNMNLLVRTTVPPRSVVSALRVEIANVDSQQPISDIKTVDELMDGSRAQPRFTTILVGAFGVTALTLAVIGIYGVLSYAVTQRRQEFGVRLALGAEQADIVRLVLRQGLRLTMAGIAIGLIFALLFIGLVSSLLYQVGARDPLTFVLAPILLLVVAFLACYLPARRATRIDAMAALR